MKIKNAITSIYISIFTLLFIISGLIIYNQVSKTLKLQLEATQEKILEGKTETISFYMQGLINEMIALSREDIMKTSDKELIAKHLKIRLDEVKDRYSNLFYSDLNGKNIGANGKTADISDRDYFKDLIKQGNGYVVSRPLISKTTGKAVFVIAVMIKNEAGENIGILGNNVLLDTISQISNSVKVGKSGYAWIVDDETTVLAHPVEEARMTLNLKTTDDLKNMKENAHLIIEQDRATFEVQNLNKIPVIINTKKIPNTPGWAFGISIPTKELYEEANQIIILILSLIPTCILIVSIISYIIAKKIADPITLTAAFANRMAEHKYEKYIDDSFTKRKNEIGLLSTSFNSLVSSMVDIVTELKKSSENVASSSIEMSSQMALVAEGAMMQSERKNELEADFSEMETKMRTITDNVRTQVAGMEEISNEASLAAEEGSKVVREALDGMKMIEEITKKIDTNIVSIYSISDQTNLLALNAAIEAARAGEAGRGFAVVADEIRKLAETSNKFTEIISELVKEMRAKVKDNIENSTLAEEKLKEINYKVLDTNVKIEKVSKAMEEQADSTKEVAEAIHSLSESSTDIEMQAEEQKEIIAKGKDALNKIKDVIEHQTASTEEVAAASEELANLAEILDGIVRKFDISAGKK